MKINKRLVWLDDYRDPAVSPFLQKYVPDHSEYNIVWVKSYNEFVKWIADNGLPSKIAFDHDLADEHYAPPDRYKDYNDWAKERNFQEKTGMDCVKWLIDYCIDNKLELPMWVCHSANPAGVENMSGLLKSFMKFQLENDTIS